jgi:23S rRNA (guanosine2251-2'-O)-methyltransferase
MVIGRNAVIEAMKEGKALDRIYLDNKATGEAISIIRKLATQYVIPVNYVPVEKLASFNAGAHEGCIALISKVKYQDLQEIISWVVEKGEVPLFLMLDGVTDIRNIGGIARTALCTGVQALIIPDKGVGALNEDAILTSAGALESLPVCRVGSLMKAVDELHLNGISVYASQMKGDKKLSEIDFTTPATIIMGSEEKGIHPALMKQCDERFRIPMHGEFDSLNVSVATGMILYEAMNQRFR